ncbi:MAG: Coenzyme F420 hydrogenase/dehydrogenase, beta subunit C-terminal domain, partial [Acidimicrobiales bacterium]
SMGSVGSLAGWTSTIIRIERGLLAFEKARSKLDVRSMDDPDALVRLDNLDKRIAFKSLERPFDPDGPLFIDYEDHVNNYSGTERRTVVSIR